MQLSRKGYFLKTHLWLYKLDLRVFASVSAATNCRYFFISVVWSTTVGLGAGTKAMSAAGTGCADAGTGGRQESAALIYGSQCDLMYPVKSREPHSRQFRCRRDS